MPVIVAVGSSEVLVLPKDIRGCIFFFLLLLLVLPLNFQLILNMFSLR